MSPSSFTLPTLSPAAFVRLAAMLVSLAMVTTACGTNDAATDTSASPATASEATAAPAASESATATPDPTATPPPTAAPPTATPPTGTTDNTDDPDSDSDSDSDSDESALAGGLTAGCSADADITTGSANVVSGGNTYAVDMSIPANYKTGEPNPVIINFHGIGSNGFEQAGFTLLSALTTSYITLHPTGQTGPDDDRRSWELPQFDTDDRDDVAFTSDLIDWVAEQACVDLNRVYAMGMSNGAFMTSTLVCDLGRRIAAAASVAGVTHTDDCDPVTATPYIAFHGTGDTTVPFNGGGFSSLAGTSSDEPDPFFEQVMPDEFGEFATSFACGAALAEDVSDTVVRYTYPDCDDDVELAFYEIDGAGHTWPGSFISMAIPSLGPTDMSVNATLLILEFFDRHSLNGAS